MLAILCVSPIHLAVQGVGWNCIDSCFTPPYLLPQGKTESAKLYGRILREMSLLSDGECVVRGSSALVGGHEGATKVLVNALMDSVKGKVLLIDEAHQLAESAYGKEALGVLVERVQVRRVKAVRERKGR